ncbi:MAG: hypothetical protein ACJA2W_004000 [Planctomycetota bacterium]
MLTPISALGSSLIERLQGTGEHSVVVAP